VGGCRIRADCLWLGGEEFGGWFCNLGQSTDGLVDAAADVAVVIACCTDGLVDAAADVAVVIACCAAVEIRASSLGTPFFTGVSEFGV
jgi:hypothetical protein